ncbi:MAG: NADH-ubiquinone oxidoreductase-F iron-sulfur binding region domain-containing protein [Candidatus Izemoplasmatales bacterium]|jgi:NADH-quinone oxidoreductase subunit F|nr:NADH-ubiquinone oxidoreductase-F iron-sulfur binding region domain-containing protein [Candidatus Izemoplasmatales bacterium]MDD4595380.1 NADH-ubiquinone oxidoreductase-F iron-sulfur binding region domain-containing protein [Candidatus Izemoplasmatales bacterium]
MIEKKIISKRFDKIDPYSIADYIATGGYKPLIKAMTGERIDILSEVEKSRLRGRGGAGFPVAIKMMALAKEAASVKYIVCNADEGEPGNFKDRAIMEKDPHSILEGMIITAYATRATKGYIYIRCEYDKSIEIMRHAVDEARKNHFLGLKIDKIDFDFDIEIRLGAGSYVCGEEFALLESIEGKTGRTRVKPPFPTSVGLFGKPTEINNVETFANIPVIVDMGGDEFAKIGTKSSTGTKLLSLSGNVNNKGVYEIPFGIPIKTVIDELGGGVPDSRALKMVQLGGACGPIIPRYLLDMIIDFDRFDEFESKTGSGAIIVMDDRWDIFDILLRNVDFFKHESCGKCAPCREGHNQLARLLRKFTDRKATVKDLISIESLARVMHQTSLCGLGQTSPTSIISTLRYFREDYIDRLESLEV